MVKNIVNTPNKSIITFIGELDMNIVKDIKNIFYNDILPRNVDIEVDLIDVSYIDSTILGFFIHLKIIQKNKNKKFKITKVSNSVNKIMMLSSVDEIFDI